MMCGLDAPHRFEVQNLLQTKAWYSSGEGYGAHLLPTELQTVRHMLPGFLGHQKRS